MVTAIIAVTVVISISGVLLVRRYFGVGYFKRHHDVAGPIFNTAGVIYAVLLGFVLVIVWQDYDKTNDNAVREVDCYVDIYRDLAGMDEPFRSQARSALIDYLHVLKDEEWPLLAYGEHSMKAEKMAADCWQLVAAYVPVGENQKAFYAEILHKMNEAGELRQQRIIDAATGINPVLWFILIVGGLINVIFMLFFGSENIKAQIVMTMLLSMLIGLVLLTILIMDFPFSGDVSIGPRVFKEVLPGLK
jgi:hypothetical protein